jgi:hypothetical protein
VVRGARWPCGLLGKDCYKGREASLTTKLAEHKEFRESNLDVADHSSSSLLSLSMVLFCILHSFDTSM